jgi:hypothetical protein
VVHLSDFPAGVVNVLTGDSNTLLTTLVDHQEVAGIWAPGITASDAEYIEWASSGNFKRTWVDNLPCFNSLEQVTDCRELFELYSTRTKAIWMPCGEIFANWSKILNKTHVQQNCEMTTKTWLKWVMKHCHYVYGKSHILLKFVVALCLNEQFLTRHNFLHIL